MALAAAWFALAPAIGSITALAGDSTSAATAVWTNYNTAVLAYAQKDYAAALQRWQDLSLQPLPGRLRRQVWFQLGNAEFRLGEPLEATAPEQAAESWRRSCEDYRVVLTAGPRDADARHNLALVEQRLARLVHRLGMESFRAATNKPLDTEINLLRASTENLNEAVTLAPADRDLRADRDRADQALRARLLERARQAERRGDDSARQTQDWAERHAEEQYRASLEDLGDARRQPANKPSPRPPDSLPKPDALDQTVTQAEQRVNQKLADLLTRIGQREQKEAREQAGPNPEQALDHYETALDRFQAAQQAEPDHEAARRGEREVRAEMEQLHVGEGRETLKQGREELAQEKPQAAASLTTALGHFQAALELNENNLATQAGAEEARRLLPAALALAGQDEMRAGDHAERNSASDAMLRYQQAETDFQQALGLKPGQPQAAQGLREVEPKLARMRDRLAREADSMARQNQRNHQRPETLSSLLGQVNERERTPQLERQRQAARKFTDARRNYPDW